jgi:hypothetical protein
MEAQFTLRGVADEMLHHYLVLEVLPEATVGSAGDLVAMVPLLVNAYKQLRHRLLAGHCLTEFQQVEKLFQVQPLGGQHSTELLAYMMQLYPDAEAVTKLFKMLFMQCLPKDMSMGSW